MKQIGIGGFNPSAIDIKRVLKVIKSGRLSYGDNSRQFEGQFAKRHNAKYAVFCNSGTSALVVALGILKEKGGWKDGEINVWMN